MEISSGCTARPDKFTGRLILALLLGTTLFAPIAFGAVAIVSPCVEASLAVYDTPGFSCMLEGYTMSGFKFTPTGSAAVTDSQITVNPMGSTPSSLDLQFFKTDMTRFAGQAVYTFEYLIDPILPTIDTQTMDLGPNDPVSLTGNFCGDGTFNSDNSCIGMDDHSPVFRTLGLSGPSTDTQTAGPVSFDPVSTEDVQLILNIPAGSTALSLGATTDVVPEPSLLAVVLVLSLLMFVKHFFKP